MIPELADSATFCSIAILPTVLAEVSLLSVGTMIACLEVSVASLYGIKNYFNSHDPRCNEDEAQFNESWSLF